MTYLRASYKVSPVLSFSILPMAPMSPQVSSLTSSVFFPFIKYRRPSFSFCPVVALIRVISEVREPEMTFTREYLPYWSATVLNTKAAGTAPAETMNSMGWPFSSRASRGAASVGAGSRSTMALSRAMVPRPV